MNEIAASTGEVGQSRPVVRKLAIADLMDALTRGIEDFRAVPTHLAFLVLIYPAIGLLGARVMAGANVVPLVWPMLAGFTLLGPVFAAGMYELSRRRERGEPVSRMNLFSVLRSPSRGSIALLSMALFMIWIRAFGTRSGLDSQPASSPEP